MSLRDDFPRAVVNSLPQVADMLTVPYGQQFLHIPLADLTARERLLIRALTGDEVGEDASFHPWYAYLFSDAGVLPQPLADLQVLYLTHASPLVTELQEVLAGFLPHLQAMIAVGSQQTALILDGEQAESSLGELSALLPTLESDFGLRLQLFVGNCWHQQVQVQWPELIQAELALFRHYFQGQGAQTYQGFAQVLLWGLMHQALPQVLVTTLRHLIVSHKDGSELISAMWQTHGNLVQTAQKLFIHRNSLSYKLDKFTQQTGLNLKNLDDLALCQLLNLQT